MGNVGLRRKGEITLEEVVAELKRHPQSRRGGAIACFIGFVREDPIESGAVQYLEYEAYREVAEARMQEIRQEFLKKEGVIDISIHHVVDTLKVGEDSIYVAVLGKHRKDVFPVLEAVVEKVKTEVPIWKKETTTSGSYWVSERLLEKARPTRE